MASIQSAAPLPEDSLLATCAYIDLNPLAAGIASTPEDSPHISFRQRVDHAQAQANWEEIKKEIASSFHGSRAASIISTTSSRCQPTAANVANRGFKQQILFDPRQGLDARHSHWRF